MSKATPIVGTDLSTVGLYADAVMVIGWLSELGLKCNIAGGFARDVCHGVTPKDADIIVYGHDFINSTSDTNAMSMFEAFCEHNKDNGNPLFHDVKVFTHYPEAAATDRMCKVVQFPELKVDVIFYQVPEAKQLADVANKYFDFNINCYTVLLNNAVYCGDTPEGDLQPVRQDFSETRRDYINSKAKSLGWRVADLPL